MAQLPAPEIEPPAYRQLAVTEILALPFWKFYEALRSAPEGAREKWASELAAMPDGPRRTAAVSGFYKLLVQFDPTAAVKAIRAIEDVKMQCVALGAAVDAAPGSAMPKIAELSLSLENATETVSSRDYLLDVLFAWMEIDAGAVGRFISQHPETEDYLHRLPIRQVLIPVLTRTWAEADPAEARRWLKGRGSEGEDALLSEEFIDGWYVSDRAAAVAYVLAHSGESGFLGGVGAIVRNLYSDSREEAAKFVQSLPEDVGADALREAFRRHPLGSEEAGDTVRTSRAFASWMTTLPPAYWQGALGSAFFSSTEMLQWIEEQPLAIREKASEEFRSLGDSTVSDAAAVFQSASPDLQERLLTAMLRNERHAPSATEFQKSLDASSLSPSQQQRLLRILQLVSAEKNAASSAKTAKDFADDQ
ncbi:MAG: hypothetical protein ABIR71_13615 [Chthoniobacterales bacterium]